MASAHSRVLSRPAGFALLRPAQKPHLDATRILTLSGTMALNLLAFGLLMMPLAMPPPATAPDAPPTLTARQIPKPPEVVPIVPVTQPRPRPPVPQVARPTVAPRPDAPVVAEVVTDTGSDYVAPTIVEDAGPTESIAAEPAGPAPVQLQYRDAPAPVYPRRAQQLRLSGTVLLQVTVGLDGRPLDVAVARSSGHRELDEAARAQVLKRWRFQPAMRDGRAVEAIGLVPIQFELAR
jgi:protein TonB